VVVTAPVALEEGSVTLELLDESIALHLLLSLQVNIQLLVVMLMKLQQ
jgi:hypothetical protein